MKAKYSKKSKGGHSRKRKNKTKKQNATEQQKNKNGAHSDGDAAAYEQKEDKSIKNLKVKLPKLVVTRFNGTHINYFRFWNQFKREIDWSKMSGVSKFFYIRELIFPKVKIIIDEFPFTSEIYFRAKNILICNYGKSSEVGNVHIQAIMSLSYINCVNFKRYMNSLRNY